MFEFRKFIPFIPAPRPGMPLSEAHTEGDREIERKWQRFHKELGMPLLAKAYFSGVLFLIGVHIFCAGFLKLEASVTYAAMLALLAGYYFVSAAPQRRLLRVGLRNEVVSTTGWLAPLAHLRLIWAASRLTKEEERRFYLLRYWQMLSDLSVALGFLVGLRALVFGFFSSFPLLRYLYYRLTE